MSRPGKKRAPHGGSLIELIISIAAIGIAVGGTLLVFATTVGHSADPMMQQQALAIAEAYLDEILTRPAVDPTETETGGAEAGETRAYFDDVQDFHGLTESPRMQTGIAVAELERYAVTVAVRTVSLGPATLPAPALEVSVTVTHPPEFSLGLTGYRGVY